MRLTNELAFVLHARAWRETSLLVEVLTREHGRLGVVARGVTGPKKHVLRAALQPLQFIRLDVDPRGELARLVAAEAIDTAPRLSGDAALAGFYVNELVLRLAPRHDAVPDLFSAYARVRARLDAGEPLAWTLRRFERDLLEALGFGFALDSDADGDAIDAAARYQLDPEQGPLRLRMERGQGERNAAATGRALLALAQDHDASPPAEDLASLRLALRTVLTHHLGARGLKSWDMLSDLGRLTRGD